MILARIISILANPVFILIALPYFLIFKETNNPTQAWNWTLYTLIYLLLFCAFVLFGVKKKIFNNIDVSNKKQRPLLYFIGGLLSFIYLINLYLLKGPPILSITTFGIILGIVIAAFINIKIKVSMHVASFSALITALSIVYGGYFLLLLLLIPLIGWARVNIERHTTKEVIVGAMLGILLSLIMYIITLKIFIYNL
jgi:membrane-associated phospholipid phosphatase